MGADGKVKLKAGRRKIDISKLGEKDLALLGIDTKNMTKQQIAKILKVIGLLVNCLQYLTYTLLYIQTMIVNNDSSFSNFHSSIVAFVPIIINAKVKIKLLTI